MVKRDDWAQLFLQRCGYPVTQENMVALVAWQAAEGGPSAPNGQARYNPLNTTLKIPGSTFFNYLGNNIGVQNYPSLYGGLDATKRTLKQTKLVGYHPIRRALKKGDSAERVLKAVENSTWGTGGLAFRIIPWVRQDARGDRQTYWNVNIGQ